MIKEWVKCNEDNYPNDNESDRVLFAYKLEEDGDWIYNTFLECPYGWNVLCSINAYMMVFDEPKIDNNNMINKENND